MKFHEYLEWLYLTLIQTLSTEGVDDSIVLT